ncbi:sulfatase-like hydrolase/transferase [Verrucomicrobiaceae bacterium N1E253]|uniref:Sulfatase-like hydrolase/transferase n=1 Tax=Oceaniferula marina TaxID=2748318 RepID=A0A851GFC8_9BACT|nr:sulfatase-like hydrolase/transferase [Oceaniferula marina]NWK56233.1 sulfatase-like hydrolase/transferase [Oceaniferula marina]
MKQEKSYHRQTSRGNLSLLLSIIFILSCSTEPTLASEKIDNNTKRPLPVFIIAGQSNAVRLGSIIPDPNKKNPIGCDIHTYLNTCILKSNVAEKRHQQVVTIPAKSSVRGAGEGMARELATRYPDGFGVIRYAICGSSLHNDWKPDEKNGYYQQYFEPFIAQGMKALEKQSGRKAEIKAVFWHQGESNSHSLKTVNDHGKLLPIIIHKFHTRYNNVPFILGEIREFTNKPNHAALNAQMRKIAAASPFVDIISSRDAEGQTPSNVHFSSRGCAQMAARYVTAWESINNKQVKTHKSTAAPSKKKPNIIIILADDLGYGDLKSYNKEAKINSPNLNKLADTGIRFTNAHTSSSVCSPSRYSLLTGRYNWRSRLKQYVTGSFSHPIIEHDRITIASFLKNQNYQTALVGKWHLGMGWRNQQNLLVYAKNELGDAIDKLAIDPSKEINGPLEHGFDYFFGLASSLNMPPYCYIRNKHVVGELDTTMQCWGTTGYANKNFEFQSVMDELTNEATRYIKTASKKTNPFFLLFSLTAPHTPVVPAERFTGYGGVAKSKYADFIYQIDDSVGQLMSTLKNQGVQEDTLIIFLADNGYAWKAANPGRLAKVGHNPAGPLRGTKGDIFEGGHRVPSIINWEGTVQPQVNDKLACITDLFATIADLADYDFPDSAGEDSISMLPYLHGETKRLRHDLVSHSVVGKFSFTNADGYKAIFARGSGGWGDRLAKDMNLPKFQLYNLDEDIAETRNLYPIQKELFESMRIQLADYILDGRSTPGKVQKNHDDIVIFKGSDAVLERAINRANPEKNKKAHFISTSEDKKK